MSFVRFVPPDETALSCERDQLTLFDARPMLSVFRDEEDSPKRPRSDQFVPSLAVTCTEFLAFAAENAVNVFQIGSDLKPLMSIVDLKGNVVGMRWLEESGLLFVASSESTFYLVSVLIGGIIASITIPSESWTYCMIHSIHSSALDSLFLEVHTNEGRAIEWQMTGWSTIMKLDRLKMKDHVEENKLFDQSKFTMATNLGKKRFDKSILLPNQVPIGVGIDGTIRTYSRQRKTTKDIVDCGPIIRLRSFGHDHFLAILTETYHLLFLDPDTQMILSDISIPHASSEFFTDFAFLETPDSCDSQCRLIFIVGTETQTQIQVRSLDSIGEVLYSCPIADKSYIVPTSESVESERLLVLLEAMDPKASQQSFTIRELMETRPEQRFERLIHRGLLDEAEAFAVQNGLDVQRVHIARVDMILNEMKKEEETGQSTFERFIEAMGRVEDSIEIGNYCMVGVSYVTDGDMVSRLIDYAEKKKILSEVVNNQLSLVSYNFASYRMIFGPCASFTKGSSWGDFLACSDWLDKWASTLSCGLIAESRIIWQRYAYDILPKLESDTILNTFDVFFAVIKNYPLTWHQVINHLEKEVVPALLSTLCDTTATIDRFAQLIDCLACSLERDFPQDFPDNALTVVSAMESLAEELKNGARTSLKAAEFLCCCTHSVETFERMNRRVRDLRQMKKLKEVYECPLSYNKFKSLSTQDICHEILQRSIQNPAQVRERIDRIARRYMEEHSLDVDETLLAHIKKVSSSIITASEPIDIHCLLVSDAITTPRMRARAILVIASTAFLPWNIRLQKGVEDVLGNKKISDELKKELRESCDQCELALILQQYGLPRQYVEAVTESSITFSRFLKFLLINEAANLTEEQRYEVATKAVNIYERMNERSGKEKKKHDIGALSMEKEAAVTVYLQKGQLDQLHSFVVAHKIEDEVIEILEIREQSACLLSADDDESSARRRRDIETLCSMIQRHRSNDRRLKELYDDLRRVLKIRERYAVWTNHLQLRDKEMRKGVLLNFITRKPRDLDQAIDLAVHLGMTNDETYCILLEYSMPCKKGVPNDIKSALYVSKIAMRTQFSASPHLLQMVLNVCKAALEKLSKLPVNPIDISGEQADEASVEIDVIEEILPSLLEKDGGLLVTEEALQMAQWVSLARSTIRQMEDSQKALSLSSSSLDEEQEKKEEEVERGIEDSSSSAIGSFRRRVGVYEPRHDGPIFAPIEGLIAVCGVADCFIEKREKIREDEMADKFNHLMTFFSLGGQYTLEMRARILLRVRGGKVETKSEVDFVTAFVERLLSQHPCDLILAATLIGSLSEKAINTVLINIGKWAGGQKSPQTVLNLCRLAQLFLARVEEERLRKDIASIKVLFVKALWEKKLGKRGIIAHQAGNKAIAEFSDKLVEPEIVREFLSSLHPDRLPSSWNQSRSSKDGDAIAQERVKCGMRVYLTLLLDRASKITVEADREDVLNAADITLSQELSHAVDDVNYRKETYTILEEFLLNDCCPYAHEVIHFVIRILKDLRGEESDKWKVYKNIANFLSNTKRIRPLCKEERQWYTEREEGKSVIGTSNRSVRESETFDGGRRLVVMPPLAEYRLPFHLFLCDSQVDIGRFVVPIVWNEVSIDTLPLWRELMKGVPTLNVNAEMEKDERLKLMRQKLLTKAIMRNINECQDKDECVSEDVMNEMQEFLYLESNTLLLLRCFAMELYQLPAGDARIQLLKMGFATTQRWLKSHPEKTSETSEIMDQSIRMNESLCEMQTKRLLQVHRLWNDETSVHSKNLDSLLSFIYEKHVNWDEPCDVERKTKLIEELARLNGHALSTTHERLVENWLTGGEVEDRDTVADVDMNDTMGGGMFSSGSTAEREDKSNDEFLPLPFYDCDVTRIVYILRRHPDPRAMSYLVQNYVNNEHPPGGYLTRVRSLCVLLRTCSESQLEETGKSRDDYFSSLETILNKRLVEMSVGADKVLLFANAQNDPHKMGQYVKSLLNGSQRSRPHVITLAASLIVDNHDSDLVDAKVVEYVLTKLHTERKQELLLLFLKLCREKSELRRIRNLNAFWGRTLDWALKDIDDDDVTTLHKWLLFAISCPMPGGRALDSIRSHLLKKGCAMGVSLIDIASSFTKPVTSTRGIRSVPSVDFPLSWNTSSDS